MHCRLKVVVGPFDKIEFLALNRHGSIAEYSRRQSDVNAEIVAAAERVAVLDNVVVGYGGI